MKNKLKTLIAIANALDERGLYKEASKIDAILSNISETTKSSYTVKAGDSLSQIALNLGTTVDDIKKLNNLTSDKILAGQELAIPSGYIDWTSGEEEQDILDAMEELRLSEDSGEIKPESSNTEKNIDIIAATLMGEGGSVFGPDMMRRIYTIIRNRGRNRKMSLIDVVLYPKQFSYWNGKDVDKEILQWKNNHLPIIKEWWAAARKIVKNNEIAPEVGNSTYYLNAALATNDFRGKNWKEIYNDGHHSYGRGGPPWDNYKA